MGSKVGCRPGLAVRACEHPRPSDRYDADLDAVADDALHDDCVVDRSEDDGTWAAIDVDAMTSSSVVGLDELSTVPGVLADPHAAANNSGARA